MLSLGLLLLVGMCAICTMVSWDGPLLNMGMLVFEELE